jgi:hypothetical protein
VGKWHLGDNPQFRPYSHGFNESLSHLHAASMFLPPKHPNVVNARQDFDPIDKFLGAAEPWVVRFKDQEPFQPPKYMTDYLTDEAVKVVAANKNRPFFMYLAYNAPHTPLQATREDYDALSFIPDHTMRVYAAMIRSLDRNIGRVLQSLKDQGLDDDTLVIFTSDNGGAHYVGIEGLNNPYRGWKATFYEGGTRMVEYLHYTGYNGLVIAALADGSTIYPSQLLDPTPRYDTGAFFATAQDPMRKDVLELLLRLFDREELPWPCCRIAWRSKEPSWRRVGRRFVADVAQQRVRLQHLGHKRHQMAAVSAVHKQRCAAVDKVSIDPHSIHSCWSQLCCRQLLQCPRISGPPVT